MALSQIVPVEKAYKPSKLETFAKMLDIATSIGSMTGNVANLTELGKKTSGFTAPGFGGYSLGNYAGQVTEPYAQLNAYNPLLRYSLYGGK